jgi:glycine cleavage system H protein
MDGEVVESNSSLSKAPDAINSDPYGSWLIKVRFESLPELLSASEYQALTGE